MINSTPRFLREREVKHKHKFIPHSQQIYTLVEPRRCRVVLLNATQYAWRAGCVVVQANARANMNNASQGKDAAAQMELRAQLGKKEEEIKTLKARVATDSG